MAESEYERVRKRAYEIWEEEGRPWGRDSLHWERANQEVIETAEITPPLRVASAEQPEPPVVPELVASNVQQLKDPAKRRAKKTAV